MAKKPDETNPSAAPSFEEEHAAAIQRRINGGLTREEAVSLQREQVAHLEKRNAKKPAQN